MKRILITGKSSYIGTKFEEWISQYPDEYEVDGISLRDKAWKELEFSKYDVVYHVAGIAHRRETDENRELYYKINRDLAYEVAQKSKVDGVRQFIFLSTMSVYGLELGIIDEKTLLKPKNAYGKSKLEAEELIKSLEDKSFMIAIIRPPMVYGKGCKGNYQRLAKLALKTPIFPDVDNKRSMIYIDNLSEFVKLVIDDDLKGPLFPQNREYINTTELVQLINKAHGKGIKVIGLFIPLINLGIMLFDTFGKVFGSLNYNKEMMGGPDELNYETCLFEKSIEKTET